MSDIPQSDLDALKAYKVTFTDRETGVTVTRYTNLIHDIDMIDVIDEITDKNIATIHED